MVLTTHKYSKGINLHVIYFGTFSKQFSVIFNDIINI